jgi:hypothetical protein
MDRGQLPKRVRYKRDKMEVTYVYAGIRGQILGYYAKVQRKQRRTIRKSRKILDQ